ncbi:unnamed protein product [Hyaloperonospora brassicae]|uniref:Uncharacterized protein n=1 Tax=Hyaloperonospora brassicae TaxID=162125 RepID=A0AAV0UE81_HYABA|nr:unnamed protein product [Hyaloperonospora brassicae]
MWTRVQTHYSALAAAENPAAIPRAGGALQTHWSSFIRPDSFFFMSLLLTVETEEHEAWSEEEYIQETLKRFETIRKAEEAEAMRTYDEAKHQAALQNADASCKPRVKSTKFRYVHCISILRTSKRFMHAVMLEKTLQMRHAPAHERQRRSKSTSRAEVAVEASAAFDDSSKQHDRSSAKHEPSVKRWKSSDALPEQATSLASDSSPLTVLHGDSSDEETLTANGTATIHAVPAPTAASFSARRNDMPRDRDTLNSRTSSIGSPMLQLQRKQQKANYRLKLLTELRGIVETISHLASQIASDTAAPIGMTAGSRLDPTLAREVQQDLHFFREQKHRLRQELEALDGIRGRARVDS